MTGVQTCALPIWPFNTTEDRKYFLESLKFVKEVVVFDSRQELIDLVKEYEPDYMIVGDDYKDQIVYGSEHAKKLVFFEKIPAYSTTKILNYENSSNRWNMWGYFYLW